MKAKRINETINDKDNNKLQEVHLFDEVGNDLEEMILKLRNLADHTEDPKWYKALSILIQDLYYLEEKMVKYNQKLGTII